MTRPAVSCAARAYGAHDTAARMYREAGARGMCPGFRARPSPRRPGDRASRWARGTARPVPASPRAARMPAVGWAGQQASALVRAGAGRISATRWTAVRGWRCGGCWGCRRFAPRGRPVDPRRTRLAAPLAAEPSGGGQAGVVPVIAVSRSWGPPGSGGTGVRGGFRCGRPPALSSVAGLAYLPGRGGRDRLGTGTRGRGR